MPRRIRAQRKLGLTPLIDVIFLLLLFFMLTSTFTNFSEVELASAGAGQQAAPLGVPPLFLQVGPEQLRVNGDTLVLDTLASAVADRAAQDKDQPVLISLRDGVTAQRLTDVLILLHAVQGLKITVLGTS
ncbi:MULTISPECIES: biopolymer transporter ExbD [Roseobacteraceae]|uniref:ExbD/TolR family protein n=1 Tax=Roseobacteraceae TaxID=2854170 RepID=UPI003296C532